MAAPFHRLLAFYSNRSDMPDTQTVRLQDSIRGNLALGLDFPVAFGIAVGRHFWLKNTGWFSLNIHVPSVTWKATPMDGVAVEPSRKYTCSELVGAARRDKGIFAAVDAVGLWALAADVHTGLLDGDDVVSFQKGTLFQQIERRRKDKEQVLPFYRGGPLSWVCSSC